MSFGATLPVCRSSRKFAALSNSRADNMNMDENPGTRASSKTSCAAISTTFRLDRQLRFVLLVYSYFALLRFRRVVVVLLLLLPIILVFC